MEAEENVHSTDAVYHQAGLVKEGPARGWDDGSVVKGDGYSFRGPGSVPSTYITAHNHL